MMTDHVLHRVTSFVLVKDYVLNVTFEDGFERTIDLEPILVGPIFGALRDRNLFKQVTLDRGFGALEWPNGADIDPAVLYDWPSHVDAIVERRQQLFAVPA
jgi:hypothetical protein